MAILSELWQLSTGRLGNVCIIQELHLETSALCAHTTCSIKFNSIQYVITPQMQFDFGHKSKQTYAQTDNSKQKSCVGLCRADSAVAFKKVTKDIIKNKDKNK